MTFTEVTFTPSASSSTSLSVILSARFSANEKRKAQDYIATDRIEFFSDAPKQLDALIQGNGSEYRVRFTLAISKQKRGDSQYGLRLSCTCPAFEKYDLCKHIWAAAVEAGSQKLSFIENLTNLITQNTQEVNIQSKTGNFGEFRPISIRGNLTEQAKTKLAAAKKKKRMVTSENSHNNIKSWKSFLDESQLRTSAARQATLNTHSTQAVSPLTRRFYFAFRQTNHPLQKAHQLEIYFRTLKKSGELGALQSCTVSRATAVRFSDLNIQPTINLLTSKKYYQEELQDNFGSSYYYQYSGIYAPDRREISSFAITKINFEVISTLSKLGRLILIEQNAPRTIATPLSADQGEWQVRYRVVPSDSSRKNTFKLSAFLFDSQTSRIIEATNIDPAIKIVDNIFLYQNCLYRILNINLPELAEHTLFKRGVIELVGDEVAMLLAHATDLGASESIELVGIEPLTFTIQNCSPRITLTSNSSDILQTQALNASIEFLYENIAIAHSDPRRIISIPTTDEYIQRNHQLELSFLTQLTDALAQLPTTAHLWELPVIAIDGHEALPLVDKLMNAGWEVWLEKRKVQRLSQKKFSLASGIDWLEVHGQFEFDQNTLSIETLIEAARARQRFVQLGSDGAIALIPMDLARKIASLATLGVIKDGAIRLDESQALWIDLLLGDLLDPAIQVDQRITHARRALSGLQGILPARESSRFKGTLRDYQRFGLGWLKTIGSTQFGACLADDMGLGKTVQVLALLDLSKGKAKKTLPSLIVAPKSLIDNWLREAKRFTPHLKTTTYYGGSRNTIRDQMHTFDIICTTYGTLLKDIGYIKDREFGYVILDEAQAIKNAESLTAKACRLIKGQHKLALSGTPIENSLDDICSIFDFLNPGLLGRLSMQRRKMDGEQENKELFRDALSQGLKPFILRRDKKDVLTELPDKTEQVLYCEMSEEQASLYTKMKGHYKASLSKQIAEKGLLSTKMHFLEALLRLRQICCDPRLLDPKSKSSPGTKIELLMSELNSLQQAGKKVLIFSQFTSFLKLIAKELDSVRYPYLYLDGQTRKRQELVDSFQTSTGSNFFLISIKAGGVGLNLTAADYCFIMDPWWNPAVEAQAIDRMHRIGQKNPVFAYKIVAKDSVEEKILLLQKDKKEIADIFTADNSSFLKSLSEKDFEAIFS